MKPDLTGRVVLVTGASRGLGAAVARAAAACGAHIIAVARTQGGLEELDDAIRSAGGEGATLVPLDLRDVEGIDRLGAAIYERWGRLDGLVGVAATLVHLTPTTQIEPKAWDETIAVNLTANARLIRSMDPLLRAASAGRAVFVTDAQAQEPAAFWGAYAASKAGLETLVRTWADEIQQSSVNVNLFEPGPMATALRHRTFPGEPENTHPAPEIVAERLITLLDPSDTRHGVFVAPRD